MSRVADVGQCLLNLQFQRPGCRVVVHTHATLDGVKQIWPFVIVADGIVSSDRGSPNEEIPSWVSVFTT